MKRLNDSRSRIVEMVRQLRLCGRSALLIGLVAVMCLVCAPLAWKTGGAAGLLACGTAAGLCLIGSATALVLSHLFNAPKYMLLNLLWGMFFRMGIPLVFGMILHHTSPVLAAGGFAYYLVAFYLVTLFVETALIMPTLEDAQSSTPEG